MAEFFTLPARATDSNANNLPGAKLYFYATGTTTPQAVYADSGLVTPLSNPVVADSAGKFVGIYLDPTNTYRAVLKTSDDVTTIYDLDPVNQSLSGSGGAGEVGFNSASTYSAGTVGKALADLYGSYQTSNTNPTLDGGLIGIAPDGNSTKTGRRDYTSLTGTRTKAVVARTIEVSDGQTGPASAAGVPTPDSASYALSLVNVRPNWNTAGTTGEADGMNIFIRQASGDSAGILSNILVRSGFAATLESYTGSADAAGAVIKAVNIQAGVVNPRDGGEYGYIAQATNGTNLTAGFTSLETGSATWGNAFQHVNAAGQALWYVRAADGVMIGGSVAPRIDAGADLGAPSLRFNSAYLRQVKFSTYTVAQLPAASGSAGLRAVVSDANATTFNSIVAGGGSNTVPVFSDGTDWRIG